jgi:hypothetical protein
MMLRRDRLQDDAGFLVTVTKAPDLSIRGMQ